MKKIAKKQSKCKFSGSKSFIGRDKKVPSGPSGTIVMTYNGKRAVYK